MSTASTDHLARAQRRIDDVKAAIHERVPDVVARWWRLVVVTDAPSRAAAAAFFAATTLPSLVVAALAFFDWAAPDSADRLVTEILATLERSAGVELGAVTLEDELAPARATLHAAGPWALLVGLFSGSRAIRVLQDTWARPGTGDDDAPEPFGAIVGRFAAALTLVALLCTVAVARVVAPLALKLEQAVSEQLLGAATWSAFAADRWTSLAVDATALLLAFFLVVQLGSRGRVGRRALAAGGGAWLLSVTAATLGWRLFMVDRQGDNALVSGVSSSAGALLWLYLMCLAGCLSLLVSRAVQQGSGSAQDSGSVHGSDSVPASDSVEGAKSNAPP